MKKILTAALTAALIVSFVPAWSWAAQTGVSKTTSGVHAYRYNMSVNLDTRKNSMDQTVTVYVRNDTGKTLKSIGIRNMAHAIIRLNSKDNSYSSINKKKSSRITSAVNVKTGKRIPLKYKKDKTVIYGNIAGSPLKPGKTMVIRLKCKVDIPRNDDRFGYHTSKVGKMYELSFCFPYISMYDNGKWNESPYFDSGENRYRSVADYRVKLKAPKSYTIAATGTETRKDGVTCIRADKVRDFAIVACNYMKKQTATIDGVRINSYYLKINRSSTYNTLALGAARDSVKLFTEKFGKYPYGELDVVQTRMGTSNGMEYPGLVMIAADDYTRGFNPKLADPIELCSIVSHEVAHEWFCVSVGNDEYKEAWLDEGFASYGADVLYSEARPASLKKAAAMEKTKLPDKAAFAKIMNKQVKTTLDGKSHFYINRPVNKYSFIDYADRVYSGGTAFLWQLRGAMGETAFENAVKEYYATYTLKEATTGDFLRIIRSYDNSSKVNKVISRYIDASYL
jgi:hypothetical protein